MILKVHLYGAASYDVGDEIWEEPLAGALHAEAEMIAGYAGPTSSSGPIRTIATPCAIDRARDDVRTGEGRRPLPRTGRCSLLADRTVCSGSAQRRR